MSLGVTVSAFLGVLPALIPALIISAIGLYYAVSLKDLAPRAFRYAAWGFSLLILRSLVGTALQAATIGMQTTMRTQGAPVSFI